MKMSRRAHAAERLYSLFERNKIATARVEAGTTTKLKINVNYAQVRARARESLESLEHLLACLKCYNSESISKFCTRILHFTCTIISLSRLVSPCLLPRFCVCVSGNGCQFSNFFNVKHKTHLKRRFDM